MTRKRFDSAPQINVKDEGLLIQQVAGSTANLLDVKKSDNTSYISVTSSGSVTLPSTTSIGNVSNTELAYLDGVTSAIQTQLNNKQNVVTNVSDTEIGYLDGVTSAIQTQLDTKSPLTQTLRSVTGASDTPTNTDNGKIVVINTTSGAVTITINGSLGLSAGQKIDFLWQGAAASVTFQASGLTGGSLNGTPGLKMRAQYSAASLMCTASNTYILIGDLNF